MLATIYNNFYAETFVNYSPNIKHSNTHEILSTLFKLQEQVRSRVVWVGRAEIENVHVLTDRIAGGPENSPLNYESWFDTIDRIPSYVGNNHVLISSSFLGQLSDPRPLLLGLRQSLEISGRLLFVLIDTNRSVGRAWSQSSLAKLLTNFGLKVSVEETSERYIMRCEYEKQVLTKVVERCNLSIEILNCKSLFVLTEDNDAGKYGGIGTYAVHAKKLHPTICTLLCDESISEAAHQRVVPISRLLGSRSHESLRDSDIVTEGIRAVLTLNPMIKYIEFQDYRHIGFRPIQARVTGLLPDRIKYAVVCHGSIDYLKWADQREGVATYSRDEAKGVVADAFIWKNADLVCFPSEYLKTLLEDTLEYAVNSAVIRRYPFNLGERKVVHNSFAKIKNLVFIGKRSHIKGWPDFLYSLEVLSQNSEYWSQIDSVHVIGPKVEEGEDIVSENVKKKLRFLHLTNEEVLGYLNSSASTSLFVMPSRGENWPYVLLEYIYAGVRFVAYASAGNADILGRLGSMNDAAFCQPDPESLAKAIRSMLLQDERVGLEICQKRREQFIQMQTVDNKVFVETVNRASSGRSERRIEKGSWDVDIVTPVYNTKIDWLLELYCSIRNSNLRPERWIIVNDGSRPDYSDRLARVLGEAVADVELVIVAQENGGLAAARNAGAKMVKSQFGLFIDSDDVMYCNTISTLITSLLVSGHYITSGLEKRFERVESLNSNLVDATTLAWNSLGVSSAWSISMSRNEFMTSLCMVNMRTGRCFVEWAAFGKATWEDWGLYLRLATGGVEFCITRERVFGYRIHADSMSRTYNRFFGRQRLAAEQKAVGSLHARILMGAALEAEALIVEETSGGISDNERELLKILRRLRAHNWSRGLMTRSWRVLRSVIELGRKGRRFGTRLGVLRLLPEGRRLR